MFTVKDDRRLALWWPRPKGVLRGEYEPSFVAERSRESEAAISGGASKSLSKSRKLLDRLKVTASGVSVLGDAGDINAPVTLCDDLVCVPFALQPW